MEHKTQQVTAHPLRIGRRFVVVPTDDASAIDENLIPLRLEVGRAFGSGDHPTTRLCLKALERHLKAGATMVDLGTGTGILAIAAAKLGAAQVMAVDIDPDSVRIASENAIANGVASQIHVEQGSLAEVLAAQAETGPATLVVANILVGVIEGMFRAGLSTAVRPGGLLILSGLLTAQTPGIRAHLQWGGFKQLAQEQEGEWVCILAERLRQMES